MDPNAIQPDRPGMNSRRVKIIITGVALILLGTFFWVLRDSFVGDLLKVKSEDTIADVILKKGSIVKGWPSDIPIMPGAADIYIGDDSFNFSNANSKGMSFITRSSINGVIDYYKEKLVAVGWKLNVEKINQEATQITAARDDWRLSISVAHFSRPDLLESTAVNMTLCKDLSCWEAFTSRSEF